MKVAPKKDALVKAAVGRFHRFGMAGSSIADVASDAAVPSGNVYYYFRTKDSLAVAVHRHWQDWTADLLNEIEKGQPDPARRILELLDRAQLSAPLYAERGCPLAALSRDFRNGSAELQGRAGDVFRKQLDWLEAQFAEIGLPQLAAASAAMAVLAAIQGGIGLSHAANSAAPLCASIAEAKRRVTALAADFS